MVLSPDGAVLLLIDLQERLMPVIADHEVVVARAVRLAEAATLLDVPVRATEQNPAGLGSTVPPLSDYPQAVLAKTSFSAAGDPGFAALLPAGGDVVVAGVEAHVCVLQTVLDLLAAGRRVILAADATGSRAPAPPAPAPSLAPAPRGGVRDVGDGAVRLAARRPPPEVRRGAQARPVACRLRYGEAMHPGIS